MPAETVLRCLRFHPHCPFDVTFVPCLVARYSPIEGDLDPEAEPTAIYRIRLDRFTGDDRKLALGPAKDQCIKLSLDEERHARLGHH